MSSQERYCMLVVSTHKRKPSKFNLTNIRLSNFNTIVSQIVTVESMFPLYLFIQYYDIQDKCGHNMSPNSDILIHKVNFVGVYGHGNAARG